ncbi:hypothetical protein BD779DRAFT_1451327 [Infundibulicybe gibba]|nr:hypothetical protein BD779DRAFT_1451327 [Infundibulicybe gibba]
MAKTGFPDVMAIDMNIEHLIGYLKALFASKGIYSNWDRLGNISAGIVYFQNIKKQVSRSMQAGYQGSTHTAVDTSALVWRVANKAQELNLQHYVPNREGRSIAKLVPDLRALGREKFESSSLATFNKKIADLKEGRPPVMEEDEIVPVALAVDDSSDEVESGQAEWDREDDL